VKLLLQDTLAGVNGAVMNGRVPNVGPAWATNSPNNVIQNNAATNTVDTVYRPVVADLGTPDVDFTLRFTANFTSTVDFSIPNICFRYQDDNNFWVVQAFDGRVLLYEVTAGLFRQRAVTQSGALTLVTGATYTLRVVAVGRTITVSLDGRELFGWAGQSNPPALTKHGFVILRGGTPGSFATIRNLTCFRATALPVSHPHPLFGRLRTLVPGDLPNAQPNFPWAIKTPGGEWAVFYRDGDGSNIINDFTGGAIWMIRGNAAPVKLFDKTNTPAVSGSRATSSAVGVGGYAAVTASTGQTNMRVVVTGAAVGGQWGPLLGTDRSNGFVAIYDHSGPALVLFEITNGAAVPRASISVPLRRWQDRETFLERQGTTITFGLVGTAYTGSYTSSSFAAGDHAGFYSTGGAWFDNFSATSPDGLTTYLSDDFNGAAGILLSAHNMDVGGPWTGDTGLFSLGAYLLRPPLRDPYVMRVPGTNHLRLLVPMEEGDIFYQYSTSTDDGVTWSPLAGEIVLPEFTKRGDWLFFDAVPDATGEKMLFSAYGWEFATGQSGQNWSAGIWETVDGVSFSLRAWLGRPGDGLPLINETALIRLAFGRLMAVGRRADESFGSDSLVLVSDDDGYTWRLRDTIYGAGNWQGQRGIACHSGAVVAGRIFDKLGTNNVEDESTAYGWMTLDHNGRLLSGPHLIEWCSEPAASGARNSVGAYTHLLPDRIYAANQNGVGFEVSLQQLDFTPGEPQPHAGLAALWTTNGTEEDATGRGNTAVPAGGAGYAAGPVSGQQAWAFQRALSQYRTVADLYELANFSVLHAAVMVRLESKPGGSMTIFQLSFADGTPLLDLQFVAGVGYRARIVADDGSARTTYSVADLALGDTGVAAGDWHMVQCGVSLALRLIWIRMDDYVTAFTPFGMAITRIAPEPLPDLRFGADQNGGSLFDGRIWQPRFAIREAGDSDMRYLYGEGSPPAWPYDEEALAPSPTPVDGGTITFYRGDTLTASLTGLGNLAGRTKLWFTLKRHANEADTAAVLQVVEASGLARLNGAAGTASQGSLTVTDQAAGTATLDLDELASAALGPGNYVADVQVLAGGRVRTAGVYRVDILADVTRATS
jgi:hypothetical protein